MITHVHIETTSRCNARCEFCAHKGMSRPQLDMVPGTFAAVLKDLSGWFSGTICPFLNGEMFLDPNLEERLELIKENIRDYWFGIHTNGVLLSEHWLDVLSRHKISYFVLSLHALNPAQHEERTGLRNKWDHIRSLVPKIAPKLKVKPLILFTDDLPAYQAKAVAADMGGEYMGAYRYTWRGRVSSPHTYVPAGPCEWPFGHLFILSNGEVVPCCMDLEGEALIGNIRDHSLQELYRRIEPYRTQFRSQLAICRGCNMPQKV